MPLASIGPGESHAPQTHHPIRHVLIHVLLGLATGAVVAVLLSCIVGPTFPSLTEASRDRGLAVSVSWARSSAEAHGGLQRQTGETVGYAFIDVDPADRPGDYQRDCRAAYQPDAEAAARPDSCDPRRPVDRWLLARVIKQVAVLKPRVVVVDLLLDGAPAGKGDEELRKALNEIEGPLMLAAPVDELHGVLPGRPSRVHLSSVPFPMPERALLGVPYPEADEPVRRYARCFLTQKGEVLPSLPFAAALQMQGRAVDAKDCQPDTAAPRIVYSVPGLTGREARPALAAAYVDIQMRCTVEQLFDASEACGTSQSFADRVVVVGASHPQRRDRHLTPLGDMSGSELVINAIRSFDRYPKAEEHGPAHHLLAELQVLLYVTAFVWVPYLVASSALKRIIPTARSTVLGRMLRSGLYVLLFVSAVTCACWLALWLNVRHSPAPDVDILVPVLAIFLEVLIELGASARHALESWLNGLFDRLQGWWTESQP